MLISAHRGFTLIELLVVISIIAILTTIGMTVYTGTQRSARDAKRRGDIDAIKKALEVNKQISGYQAISGTWFTAGIIPTEPKNTPGDYVARYTGCGNPAVEDGYTNGCWYCIQNTSTEIGYCNAGDHYINNPNPFTSYAQTGWVICANLETGSPAYYCSGSQQ